MMKRIFIILLTLAVCISASAQVGRYKSIKMVYPGYSLKLDSATGELSVIHYDGKTDKTSEEVISKKQSHDSKQIDRYEFRRTHVLGTYQIFDTASGKSITVKWKPKDKDGKEIDADIDTVLSNVKGGVKKVLNKIEKDLKKMGEEN